MNITEAKKLALNPQSFSEGDKFIVFNGDGRPVQSEFSAQRAISAMDSLNLHEARNNRTPNYHYEPVTP